MSTYLVPDATHQGVTLLRELTTGGELVSVGNPLPVTIEVGSLTIGAVTGTKTNNAAAPGATNVGALTGLANASAPTYTEGDLVLLSTDLAGNMRVNATVTPAASVVSTNNSSTTLLTANSVFTGTSEAILAYGSVSVQVFSDQASAASGLVIQQSQDGTNWDTKASYSVSANAAFQATVNATGQFLQVKYTNGATNQGTFRLQTIKEVPASPSAGVANQRVNAQSGDFVAGSIADLATLVTNTADLLADGDHLATIDASTSTSATQNATTATQTTNLNTVTGLTTDTAVTGDTAGTLSAKLRGWSKMLADMWDSTNHWLQVKVMNANANGQVAMSASAPVALASDQPGLSQMAKADGIASGNVLASALYLNAANGPVDSTGKAQLTTAMMDRVMSWQSKGIGGASTNITATTAGDTNLTFSSAPKTIMPGGKVALSVGSGAIVEWVIVSSTYTPSSTTTVIPLQFPVLNNSNTTARWSVFTQSGPGAANMLPDDLMPVMLTVYDPNAGQPITLNSAVSDGQLPNRYMAVVPTLYNGTNNDKQRGNTDVTLLASAARTTTQTSADIVNYNGRGIKVVLDATVIGTGSITVTINYKDPASGKYILLLSGAAITTNSTNLYTIYPGAVVTANASANDVLPRTFQIVVTANNANSVTYSVGYSIIL